MEGGRRPGEHLQGAAPDGEVHLIAAAGGVVRIALDDAETVGVFVILGGGSLDQEDAAAVLAGGEFGKAVPALRGRGGCRPGDVGHHGRTVRRQQPEAGFVPGAALEFIELAAGLKTLRIVEFHPDRKVIRHRQGHIKIEEMGLVPSGAVAPPVAVTQTALGAVGLHHGRRGERGQDLFPGPGGHRQGEEREGCEQQILVFHFIPPESPDICPARRCTRGGKGKGCLMVQRLQLCNARAAGRKGAPSRPLHPYLIRFMIFFSV
ncbi:MAG: hypothetical protein BWY77_01100 [bacterium ADurb.Bin431]|nr:MAG: hypothetical protein BWY77_01100 [bacterium ADurb.Bin431]